MQNSGRLLKLQALVKEAEQLARAESHLQHHERRLTRLTAVLWVCRDAIDEVVEATVHSPDPPEGRTERPH